MSQPLRRIGDKKIISRPVTTFKRFTMHSSVKFHQYPPVRRNLRDELTV